MCARTLTAILFAFIVVTSCKKADLLPDNLSPTITDSSTSGETSTTKIYNVYKTTLMQLVNEARKKGCTCGTTVMPPVNALTWNDKLGKAAYDHSVDMKDNNYFSHTGLDGSDPGKRITTAGYTWHTWGENIANGYTSEQAVMTGWLNSEGHCKNIMGAGFKELGVGRDGNYWTMDLGAK